MERDFIILHLSDAHVGNPKTAVDFEDVTYPLLEDLAKMRNEEGLVPSLIIFSGDLAFGEIPGSAIADQYKQAEVWIKSIYNSLSIDLLNVPILIVPGNHDVNRSRVARDQEQWLDSLGSEEDAVAVNDLMRENNVQWKRLIERHEEWKSFYQGLVGKDLSFNQDLLLTTGVIAHGNYKIGVVGFNTSWGASREAGDEGRLWIGQHQIQLAAQKLRGCNLRIAVTHHPTSWLNGAERNYVEQRLETGYQLHLHGHLHEQWFSPYSEHLRIAAGPCYGGSNKENAYSWIAVSLGQGSVRLKIREYRKKGKGAWGPFIIPGRTDDFGEFKGLLSLGGELDVIAVGSRPSSAIKAVPPEQMPPLLGIKNVKALIRTLDEYFAHTWEPASFVENEFPVEVFWPVRLRPVTPIHALQSFVAAALQKKGAKVHLFLDDLGNHESNPEAFTLAVTRWFNLVGEDFDSASVHLFSQIIGPDAAANAWDMVRKWLAENQYRLGTILEISKIPSLDLSELLARRPRRLLTPPLVWACLAYMLAKAPRAGVITLGGYDERDLWQVWRDSIQPPEVNVGHLYVPILRAPSGSVKQPIHMARQNLAWNSRADIATALENDRRADLEGGSKWMDQGRMAEWCIRGAILLPEFVRGDDCKWVIGGKCILPDSSLSELYDLEPATVIGGIARAAADNILLRN